MKIASILAYSKKGNTLGILELLNEDDFEHVFEVDNSTIPAEVELAFRNSDVLLIGVPTYFPTYQNEPTYPSYLEVFRYIIQDLKGKEIIVFGSGRSEYPLFCGAVDYLANYLSVENKVHSYKFEGFPKPSEQKEFRELVEGILNG